MHCAEEICPRFDVVQSLPTLEIAYEEKFVSFISLNGVLRVTFGKPINLSFGLEFCASIHILYFSSVYNSSVSATGSQASTT